MILVRHGLMVVGRPMAGKTKALIILQETLNRMYESPGILQGTSSGAYINRRYFDVSLD